jgi:hypothetical protein
MQDLLREPERARRMGGRGRARAVEQFSLGAAGARFLDWYDRALDGSRPPFRPASA